MQAWLFVYVSLFYLLGLLAKTTTGSCSSSSKRGLVDVHQVQAQYEAEDPPILSSSPLLSWVYNYGPSPGNPFPYGNLSFVPMAHDATQAQTFLSTVQGGPNYGYALGFNEPDQGAGAGGSSLDVGDAVNLWNTQIEPLAQMGYQLGAPAGILFL